MTSWVFGAAGSGLHFIITENDGKFTLKMIEGSMDLNALWYSDGDAKREGDTKLSKKDAGLAMSKDSSVDENGDPIVWDGVSVLSSAGLGKAGTSKKTYLTATEEYSFKLKDICGDDDDHDDDNDNDDYNALDNLILGVRATSVNGNGSTSLVGSIDRSPEIACGQVLSYVENIRAGTFVGSVEAIDDNAVTGFRFVDKDGKTSGTTSPDGFFTIDSTGKIRMTELGAASFANNFEDAAGKCGPDNEHSYYVQASDAIGNWSEKTKITLTEENCRCDDPNLTFLIDVSQAGRIDRIIENENIYSLTWDPISQDYVRDMDPNSPTFYQPVKTLVGPVEADKQFIRMISNGLDGVDTSSSRSILKLNSTGNDMLLSDVVCIQVEAASRAEINIKNDNSELNGQVVNADNFMSSLEKLYVRSTGVDGVNGFSYVVINNDGAANYMSSLKDITIIGGDDSARMNVYNDAYNENGFSPSSTVGDNFMSSLQNITVISDGTVQSEIRSYGGDDMMSSLKSLRYEGGTNAELVLKARVTNNGQSGADKGYNGLSTNFMKSAEVIDLSAQQSNAKLKFEVELADNFMNSLSTINMSSGNESNFEVDSKGASNVLNSLKEINFAPAAGQAYFIVKNRAYVDILGNLNDASSFMRSVETIDVVSAKTLRFELVNGERDFATGVLGKSGEDFFTSLKSINVDAGSASINFQFYNAATDANTLSSLQSLSINGGEINARLSKGMITEDWFNFSNIVGTADNDSDTFFADSSARNEVQIIAGFDVDVVDDKFTFQSLRSFGVDDITDIEIERPLNGDDVKITFAQNVGLNGEIWILDVGAAFNATDNIMF